MNEVLLSAAMPCSQVEGSIQSFAVATHTRIGRILPILLIRPGIEPLALDLGGLLPRALVTFNF